MRDFDELVPPLQVPIRGKLYTLARIGARTGARLQGIAAGEKDDELRALSNDEFHRLIMGPAFDEMVDDDVPRSAIDRAFLTALTDFRRGRAAAEQAWEAGESPEYLAAMAAQAETAKTKTTSTSTASAKKTQSRASTRSTTSPATSSARKSARPSTGRRSSPNGGS